MKPAAIICAAAMAVLLARTAPAQDSKTPAEWTAQLGAERLPDREAASAALLKLGAKARDDVRHALDSTDPEVKSRARELWKTLRWLVVPDADEDIAKLVAESDKGSIDAAHWKDFVQNHGGETLLLVAEFRAGGTPAAISRQGLLAVLENAPPMEVARVIAQTDRSDGRSALDPLLDELSPGDVSDKIASNWMQIQIALWNYEKAFDFGRDFSFRTSSPDVVKQCTVAVDRGKLLDKIQEAARKDIASETDRAQLCAKLSFYTGLFTVLGKKELVEPLLDLVQNTSLADVDDASLRRLVESLLNARLPARAVKVLHNVQSPQALYMRSAADMQIQDEPVSGTDFREALLTVDAVADDKKKEELFNLAELMNDWHDSRAEMLWQRILSLQPATTVYDANTCFRLGEVMEARHHYSEAADIYEKGLQIASGVGGILLATGPQGSASGDRVIREKIRNLRLLAAGQKSLFQNSPPSNPDLGNQ